MKDNENIYFVKEIAETIGLEPAIILAYIQKNPDLLKVPGSDYVILQLGTIGKIEKIEDYLKRDSPLMNGNTRSQDQKIYLRPNGSLYFSRIKTFLKSGSFFFGKVNGFEMSKFGSMDIDTENDLQLAQILIDLNLAESDFL